MISVKTLNQCVCVCLWLQASNSSRICKLTVSSLCPAVTLPVAPPKNQRFFHHVEFMFHTADKTLMKTTIYTWKEVHLKKKDTRQTFSYSDDLTTSAANHESHPSIWFYPSHIHKCACAWTMWVGEPAAPPRCPSVGNFKWNIIRNIS